MERFLQPGQNAIATVYAPITYSPVPLIAFQRDLESGQYSIAATGTDKKLVSLKGGDTLMLPHHSKIMQLLSCTTRSRGIDDS